MDFSSCWNKFLQAEQLQHQGYLYQASCLWQQVVEEMPEHVEHFIQSGGKACMTENITHSWLDACNQLGKLKSAIHGPEAEYDYLQLAYSRVQLWLCMSELSPEFRSWLSTRLELLATALIAFCQNQNSELWQQKAQQQSDLHALFIHGRAPHFAPSSHLYAS